MHKKNTVVSVQYQIQCQIQISVSGSCWFCNWIYLIFFLSFIFGKSYLNVFIFFYNLNKYDWLEVTFTQHKEWHFSGCNKGYGLSHVTPPSTTTITLKLQMN